MEGSARGFWETLKTCFADLNDPRVQASCDHLLMDIIAIAILAVTCGADDWTDLETFGKLRHDWLKTFLKLPKGIPSHDTFRRVFGLLGRKQFAACLFQWTQAIHEATGGKLIAIDGKALRRSFAKKSGKAMLHLVTAWSSENSLTLGQIVCEEKSNEITAIPILLDQIDFEDSIITIDAAGCQKNIAAQIVDGGGDYVLALKKNHPTLYGEVKSFFVDHLEDDFARCSVSRYEESEKSHGRIENRIYIQVTAPKDLYGRADWLGLKTIGIAVRIYEQDGVEKMDVRFYLSSLRRNGKQFGHAVRGHWGIENSLHWCLDMTYREDESRVRNRNFADNLSWLRRLTLSLIKQHPGKESNIMKRRMAGWSVDYLMQILTGKHT